MIDIFIQQVDKRAIFLLLGCYCNDSSLVTNEKYETQEYDYPEDFHRFIWAAIYNISKSKKVHKINPIDIENELITHENAYSVWKNYNGWNYIENAIDSTKDSIYNIDKYYDDVKKYSIIRYANDNLKMDTNFIYNPNDESSISVFSQKTSEEVLNEINLKILNFNEAFKIGFKDNYSFKAGKGLLERTKQLKNQIDVYGYPFQSSFLTSIFRGMRQKKFGILSSTSGGGKSRSSMANAINISCDRMYDWSKNQWVSTGEREPVLLISTELEQEEIDNCLLAHISGIEQDRIEEWNDITAKEEEVIYESARIIEEECLLYCEYMPDFTIDSITTVIERYAINYGIRYCFFDYINDSPSLYSYYYNKTKMRLRTDQILYLFSNALKLIANKYNIYLGSSTQLNDSYKDDGNKDSSAIKGSKAIIEKADFGILSLQVTQKDLQKLKPILEGLGYQTPNNAYYIYKNRGGKWNRVIVWTKLNLGTMREEDCFVTNYNYELITDIEAIEMEFDFGDVGEIKEEIVIENEILENPIEYVKQLES